MKFKVATITGLVALGIAAAIFIQFYFRPDKQILDGKSRVDAEISLMSSALESYKLDFGVYPEMRNTSVYQALSGSNPHHKPYFVFPKKMVNSNKEIVDPWGTSYEFGLVEGFSQIRSAGRNRYFELGGDDHSTGAQ